MLRIRLCAPRLNLIHLARQEQFHYTVLDYGLSTIEARNSMTNPIKLQYPCYERDYNFLHIDSCVH